MYTPVQDQLTYPSINTGSFQVTNEICSLSLFLSEILLRADMSLKPRNITKQCLRSLSRSARHRNMNHFVKKLC